MTSDRQLLKPNVTQSEVARIYDIHVRTLSRHRMLHLSPLLKSDAVREIAVSEAKRGASLLDQVRGLLEKVDDMLEDARLSGKRETAIKAAREVRGCLELMGKLAGQIDQGPVINIFNAPAWVNMQNNIVAALAPYPEARDAVVRALAPPTSLMEHEADIARELRHALDPVAFAVDRLGFFPDVWQARILRSRSKRVLMNCTRQAGKTTVTAILALHTAIYDPGALILLFSKAQRQSSELLAKIQHFIATMDRPPLVGKDAATEIRLKNTSRMVSLPGDGDTIRGLLRTAPDHRGRSSLRHG